MRTVDTFLYYLLPELAPAARLLDMNPPEALHDQRRLVRDVAFADVVVLSEQRTACSAPVVRCGAFILLRRW